MVAAVKALSLLEPVVVTGKGQRSRERLVREPPAAVLIVQIVGAVLHENTNRLPRRLPNHRRVVMPALAERLARLYVGEAANPGQYFAELAGSFHATVNAAI